MLSSFALATLSFATVATVVSCSNDKLKRLEPYLQKIDQMMKTPEELAEIKICNEVSYNFLMKSTLKSSLNIKVPIKWLCWTFMVLTAKTDRKWISDFNISLTLAFILLQWLCGITEPECLSLFCMG